MRTGISVNQPNPHFVPHFVEDNEFSIEEVRFQYSEVRLDTLDQLRAALTCLIFSGREIINIFWDNFMESKLEKISKGCVKIKLSQVGVKTFRATIQSHVVVSFKIFFLLYQVVLLLRRMG